MAARNDRPTVIFSIVYFQLDRRHDRRSIRPRLNISQNVQTNLYAPASANNQARNKGGEFIQVSRVVRLRTDIQREIDLTLVEDVGSGHVENGLLRLRFNG